MLGWVRSHPWSPFAMGCIAWATTVFIAFPAVSLEFHVIYMVTIASLIYISITLIAPRLDSCLIVLAMLSHGSNLSILLQFCPPFTGFEILKLSGACIFV